MKCNKCGSPIIPGEDTCRICGTKADSSNIEQEEIIDFPEDKNDVEVIGEEIIDIPEPIIEVQPKVEPVHIEPVLVTQAPVQEAPITSPMEPQQIEIPNTKTPEPIRVEPVVEEKPELVIHEQPLAPQPVKKERTTKPKTKIEMNIPLLVISIVLMISLLGNVYLFIKKGNSSAGNTWKPSSKQSTQETILENYVMKMPYTWVTEQKDKQVLIYDETKDWAASLQLLKDVNYQSFLDNKDAFPEKMFNLKYQFTSNYAKTVNQKEFYLYKGKYYNYSVYVIVIKITEDNMAVIDLKFKGEVNDIVLDQMLEMGSSLAISDYPQIFKDNFDFKEIGNQVSSVTQKTE